MKNIFLSAIFLLSVFARCSPAETVKSAHVTAQLIPEVASIQPGKPFRVAVRLAMDEGWHTYWKNPGDSGLATNLKWDLPDGWEAGPIFWPYPERFKESGLATYGYHGEVFLLVELTPPLSLTPGEEQKIGVRARWLSCEKICIPGQAELAMTLPVAAEPSLPDARRQDEFARARDRLPRRDDNWQVRAMARSKQFLLRFSPMENAGILREVYFFPDQGDVINHSGEQKLKKTSTEYELSVPRSSVGARSERVTGVLVVKITDQTGSGEMAFEVDAPFTKEQKGK